MRDAVYFFVAGTFLVGLWWFSGGQEGSPALLGGAGAAYILAVVRLIRPNNR